MGNPIRRIESPASTALQVIEAHRLFHLVTVIVHGKAMPRHPLWHAMPAICHTKSALPYYAYRGILSLLHAIAYHKQNHNYSPTQAKQIYSGNQPCNSLTGVAAKLDFALFEQELECHCLNIGLECYPSVNIDPSIFLANR